MLSTYTDFNKENAEKDPKFKVGDVDIKTFFIKVTLQIGLTKFLWLKKLKILCRGHTLLMTLMVKKLLEYLTQKNCKKTNQKDFRVEKKIKRKGNRLYVKWEGYNNYFNW